MKRMWTKTALAATAIWIASGIAPAQDYNKGLSYYKQGNFAKAIAEFEPLVQANPEYEDGFRILGHCYLKTRQFAEASQAFRKSLDLKDGNIVSYLGLGMALYNQGRYKDSVAALLEGEKYAKEAVDKQQVFQIRGASYFNLGNWSKALQDFEEAQSIKRGNLNTVLQIGISHFKLGNLSEASGYLEQVLARDKGNQQAQRFLKEARFRLAALAISEKDSAKAISLLSQVAAEDPQDGEAWFNLGLAHLLAEDLSAAEDALQTAAPLLPQKAELFDRLGYIYEVTDRYQEALQAYGKAHQLSGSADSKASLDRVQERIRRRKSGA